MLEKCSLPVWKHLSLLRISEVEQKYALGYFIDIWQQQTLHSLNLLVTQEPS